MSNKTETDDLDRTITNAGEAEYVRFCESPVFRCITHTKPTRGNQLDLSDYDIPSYQINQSVKSKTSSKYGNETSESFISFSPIFSPISVAPKVQFQPPSTHTVGTVAKNLDKPCRSKISSRRKTSGVFDNLGMTDKDISWASSMASPPPKQVPGSEFNTIERATFLPEEKFHNIQPRALFSPPLDDDFGCQPIVFTSESDDDEEDIEYKSSNRLSDVCATLNQLEFKSSLDQTVDNILEKAVNEESCLISPVLGAKKKKSESTRKKKKGSLVISPETKYEFSTNLKGFDCEKVSFSETNFMEDDSFQSLSFTCLDELCKTLVSSQNNSTLASSDKILINSTIINSRQNKLKKFYFTKGSTDVYTVSSMDNLHCYVKALEEAERFIPEGKKIDQSFADKGIVRCDVLIRDSYKIDASKRLHSEVTGGNDDCNTKKLKKMDDEWENVKQYLSESQLNVSDGEIFRTVENLEKTLASQESKDLEKLSVEDLQGEESLPLQNSTLLPAKNSGNREEAGSRTAECVDDLGVHRKRKCDTEDPAPVTALELKVSENQDDLNGSGKSHGISKSELSKGGLVEVVSSDTIKQKKILPEASNLKSSERMFPCDGSKTLPDGGETSEKDWIFEKTEPEKCIVKNQFGNATAVMEGFSTCLGKKIQVSAKALEKAKAFMAQCDEKLDDLFPENFQESSEKQKLLLKHTSKSDATAEEKPHECSEEFSTNINKETEKIIFSERGKQNSSLFKGFSTGSGKTIQVSAEVLEKAKTSESSEFKKFKSSERTFPCDGSKTLPDGGETSEKDWIFERTEPEKCNVVRNQFGNATAVMEGFSTCLGKKIQVSAKALEKAKAFMAQCDEKLDDLFPENFQESSERQKLLLKHTSKSDATAEEKPHECSEEFSTNINKETEKIIFSERRKQNSSLFKGFSTGSGKTIQVSAEALEKAKTSESSEFKKFTSSERTFPCDGSKTLSNGGETSEKDWIFERTEPEKCNVVKNQFGNSTAVMEGFSTCLGKKIQVSAKALEKAKAFMAQCDEKLDDIFPKNFQESSEKQKLLSKHTSKSDATAEEKPRECSEEFSTSINKQTEKIIFNEWGKQNSSLFEGFSTGSGKTIQVSAEALEKAKTFMRNCDCEFGETSNQSETPFIGGLVNQTFQVQKAKTVDDLKEKPQTKGETSENLKNPTPDKSASLPTAEPPLLGFVTAGGSKVTISESALAKAKQRMAEWEQIKTEDSGNFDCVTDSRQKSELKKSEENQSKLSTTSGFDESDDWEEIIPSWLHVYNTSPSIACDRTELSPILTLEDGRTLKSNRDFILRSPVLGLSDRFQGKTKKRKLHFEDEKKPEKKTGFVVPYKNSEKREKTKRSLDLSLDFSVPFKKSKLLDEVTDVDVNIKERRARTREQQERRIKEKQKVKILKGSHLNRKCSEKQVSWVEAVKGCSPQVHSNDVLRKIGIREAVLDINVETALSVRLKGEDFFGASCKTNTEGIPVGDDCLLILDDDNKFGVEELKRAFLASPGVQPNLLPSGWVENHCKWIIWKLAHYERSFPQFFAGCMTPNQILVQLKYRYDREIDRNERSALKKILERDDTPAKRLVLCVCGIKKVTAGESEGYELKLTDGWYSCPARSDPAMIKLIEEGKLTVGTKLLTQGATLINCEQGASPLEVGEDTYLKISTNSTRRARWDTKLGFQKNPKNFPISLGSILPQGGPISRVDVIIVRTYPVLYMEKTSDGRHVTRNRRLEEKADAEYSRIQEQRMESVYNEVQSELRNSVNFEKKLASSQSDHFGRELSEKIEKKLEKEKLNKRNVSEFLRAKIVDFRKPDYNNPAVLSVWNPNEHLMDLLVEGKVVSLMNVTINNSTRIHKPLQINTTRQTQYSQISRSVKYPSRKLTKLKDVSSKFCPAFEEVDVVGMVSLVRDVSYGSRLSQVVYLTDLEMNFVGVVFWGSCKDYGWENVLRAPSIVSCSNLQWKKNHIFQDVPSLYVIESSVFTENPKQTYLREEMERLKQNRPQDLTEFLSKCEESLTTKLEDSKWRPSNSSKNSSGNDSTLRISHPGASRVMNGFESKPAASSTPIKPFNVRINSAEEEPSPIQKRIEKLQNYGEPSPLVPLVVRNKPKKYFKKAGGGFTSR